MHLQTGRPRSERVATRTRMDVTAGAGRTTRTRGSSRPPGCLLATKILRPDDTATRAEAVRILRDRHCADGGWNYGSTSSKGVDLRGYAQTTAVALMGLQGEEASLVDPALRFLQSRWRDEPGGLTLAHAAVALDLHGVEGADEIRAALETAFRKTGFLGNLLALGWAALAASRAAVDGLRSA